MCTLTDSGVVHGYHMADRHHAPSVNHQTCGTQPAEDIHARGLTERIATVVHVPVLGQQIDPSHTMGSRSAPPPQPCTLLLTLHALLLMHFYCV